MIKLIVIASVLLGLAVTVLAVLHHPAFGPHPLGGQKTVYHNEIPTPQFTGKTGNGGQSGSGIKVMWHFLTDNTNKRVPEKPVETVQTDLFSLPLDKDWLVWFGHSSYLFALGGNRILVDPVLKMEFPASVMMKPFPGSDLYTPDNIPDIDLLVITHEHWDHLDYATLRDLRPKIKHIICPSGIGEYMTYWGFAPEIVTEMKWYEKSEWDCGDKNKVVFTCLPTRHFSNRLLGANRTLWASFMLESNGRQVYIGGDGGYDDRFIRIRNRFGHIDLAIMENGQYNKNWAYIHLLPEDLEQAMLDLQAEQYITVHHDKFSLAPHAWDEPDSVAHSIAEKDRLNLLDRPIGSVIYY